MENLTGAAATSDDIRATIYIHALLGDPVPDDWDDPAAVEARQDHLAEAHNRDVRRVFRPRASGSAVFNCAKQATSPPPERSGAYVSESTCVRQHDHDHGR